MDFKVRHNDLNGQYDGNPDIEATPFGTPNVDADVDHPPNVRVSTRPDGQGHYLFLDLDVEHEYVPSSTPGHGHLVVNTKLSTDSMLQVLSLLAEVGVVQHGYAKATAMRGEATLRLPGVKKELF